MFWGQIPCRVIVKNEISLTAPNLSLSDLIESGGCAEFLAVARQISLGRAPLPGSPRVLNGHDLRSQLNHVWSADPNRSSDSLLLNIPQRIIVRSAEGSASCSGIVAKVLEGSPQLASVRLAECGGTNRIPEDARLIVQNRIWNRPLQSWEFLTHCERPEDCVPFLVRVRSEGPAPDIRPVASSHNTQLVSDGSLLVAAGQKKRLVWVQKGIRAAVPAVCLDRGRAGDLVRVRLLSNGLLLTAIVTATGELEVRP